MIQSTLFCAMHQKNIVSICLNQNCKQSRLMYFDCLKNNEHISHIKDDVEEFENLETKIEETKLQYNNLISQLNQMMDEVLNIYQKIKKGIDDKYNLPIQRIHILTNEELTQYIDNMIQFDQYKETIKNQIKSNCQEFEQKLKNYLREQQLDTLTYNVFSNESNKMAEQLFNEGYALYWDKKDYDGAIKIFDQALSYDRSPLNSLFCKGESLRMKGLYQDSLELFDQALSIDPKNISSLFCKGKCLRIMGKRQDAIIQYDKVLQINPKHVNSLNDKGESLRMMGQQQDAILCFDKVLSIDPKHVSSLNGKGAALRQMTQNKEALEYQKKAYAIDPNDVLTLYEYGETPRTLNQLKEALIYFDKALYIDQNDYFSLTSKGACLIQLSKYKEALVCLNKSIQINPKYQFCQNQLKICQDKIKQSTQ